MSDKLVYTTMLENSEENFHSHWWQGPVQPLKWWKLKQLTRWNALDKYKKHNAGFTCDKCPEPLKNTEYYNKYTKEHYWINTVRCKPCRDKDNKYRRFKKWFEAIIALAEELDQDIYFGSVTRMHTFAGEAEEIRDASVDACLALIKDFKKMIHTKSNNRWQYYNSGLIVGEVKWRRPNTPVYETGKHGHINPSPLGIKIWGKEPIRFTEEYEAHPHCHFVALTPKIKMPYNKLNEIAHENNMNVHFERIQPWRAKYYLSRYFKKDQPSYTDGTEPRCRFKTGKLYNYKV